MFCSWKKCLLGSSLLTLFFFPAHFNSLLARGGERHVGGLEYDYECRILDLNNRNNIWNADAQIPDNAYREFPVYTLLCNPYENSTMFSDFNPYFQGNDMDMHVANNFIYGR